MKPAEPEEWYSLSYVERDGEQETVTGMRWTAAAMALIQSQVQKVNKWQGYQMRGQRRCNDAIQLFTRKDNKVMSMSKGKRRCGVLGPSFATECTKHCGGWLPWLRLGRERENKHGSGAGAT